MRRLLLVTGICGDWDAASIHLVSLFTTTIPSVMLGVSVVEMDLVDTPAGAVAGMEIDVASIATGDVIAQEVAVGFLSCYCLLQPMDSVCRCER